MSGDLDQSSLPLSSEPETNVYSFGVLMLEIISGKLSDSDEEGSILKWVKLKSQNQNKFSDFTLILMFLWTGIKVS